AKSDHPTTWPRIFKAHAAPMVPPKPPRSCITPRSHKNGSAVGIPVFWLGIEFMKDVPITCPRSLIQVLQNRVTDGPPNVPKSRLPPLSHKTRVICTPNSENGSGIVLVENPMICPRLLPFEAPLS